MLVKLVLAFCVGGMAACGRPRETTIYRDRYGVPTVVAPTLADGMAGLGYEQALALPDRMAVAYKAARGRLAEMQGRSRLLTDGFVRALGFEERAEERAKALPPEEAELIDAYLLGANRALAERKSPFGPFTRVDVLALAQFFNSAFPLLELGQALSPGAGSNAFAVAPARTSTGGPIVSIDPHLSLDGGDLITWFEFGMIAGDVSFRGVGVPGLPTGVLGTNGRVAWGVTNNDPALVTRYRVVPNPSNAAQYRYFDQWRDFGAKKIELRFRDGETIKTIVQTVRTTAWGPMIPFRMEAVSLPTVGNFAGLPQIVRMLRARDVREFRQALAMGGLSMWNFVFADAKGSIAFQYNATLPERDPSYDWRGVVPGDDPKARLGATLPQDRLPSALNPRSGILVSANSPPALTDPGGEVRGEAPAYVSSFGDTTRRARLVELLRARPKLSLAEAEQVATDTLVPNALRTVAKLKAAGARGTAAELMAKWDGRADAGSVGTALYTYWLLDDPENVRLAGSADWSAQEGAAAVASVERASTRLAREHGRIDVPWGEVLVLERGAKRAPASGWGNMAPGAGAAVVPTGPGSGSEPLREGRIRAAFGSSFRMIVSLGRKGVRARSVLPYGNSSLPDDPHYSDQMELYGARGYKDAPFGAEAARLAAVETRKLRW